MSRFYVGQRVRIKYSLGWPELAGEVGTITGFPVTKGKRGNGEWVVAPDVWGTAYAPRLSTWGGRRFAPNSEQLEPATDSHDKVEWSACLWMPEHMRDSCSPTR